MAHSSVKKKSGRKGFSSFSDRIEFSNVLSGVKVFSMKTDIDEAVNIQGSLLGGDVFNPKSNSSTAEMTATMLDQGSRHQDKFAISEAMDEVGTTIAFGSGLYHVRFRGRCLKKDIPLAIKLLAEQLRYPAMNKDDLDAAKKRHIGDLKKSQEDTQARAMETFLQEIYPENHPNHVVPLSRQIDDTRKIEANNLKRFHSKYYGTGHLVLVAVGDVNQEILEKSIGESFSKWKPSPLIIDFDESMRIRERKKETIRVITLEDKTSVDIMMGQTIGIDREHEDFYPLMMGNYILGGNFSSRLMSVIRDEKGLTYATYSALGGADHGNDGFWSISGTYAPQMIEQGREATAHLLKEWINGGVTEEELEAKKTTITGSYKVSLATTGGIASRILSAIERGKELDYIDRYPDKINSITLEQVNRTIKTYCEAGKLVTVVAGSIDENLRTLKS